MRRLGSMRFQNSIPAPLRDAWRLKFIPRPLVVLLELLGSESSANMSSCALSCTAGKRLGLDAAVAVPGRSRSRSATLLSRSRTWRIVSLSRRISVSIGAASSARAARMRAKPFVLGKRLPRLVTGRRTTPGVLGAVSDASSPLSFPLLKCNPSVPSARLSLRLLAAALDCQVKYPPLPLPPSMLLIGGGLVVLGEASELYPLLLALLLLFLLLLLPPPPPVLCNLLLPSVLINEFCAGEKLTPVPHVGTAAPGVCGPPNGVATLFGFCSLCTCGVVKTVSSASISPMLASASLSLSSLSLPIILTLPSELLTALLSCGNEAPQPDVGPVPGESSDMCTELTLPFLPGTATAAAIAMPLVVMTGLLGPGLLHGGCGCSATVE